MKPEKKTLAGAGVMDQAEVAKKLGITVQTVSLLEKRAIKKMRDEWERLDRIEQWKAIEAKEKYRCNSPNSSPTLGSHA